MGFSTIGGAGGGSAETPSGGAGSADHAGVEDNSSSNADQIQINDASVVINKDGDDLDFRIESENNANMLVVDGENDRIGIGTAAPAVLLTTAKVATDNSSSSDATLANSFVHLGQGEYGSGRYYLTTYGYSTGRTNPGAYAGALGASSSGYGKYHLVFGTRDATTDSLPAERLRIQTDGNVGISETTPSKMLDLNNGASGGDILAYDVYTHDGGVTSSDGRMKENITPSSLGLGFINSLNPVSYKWKDTEEIVKKVAVEARDAVYRTVEVSPGVTEEQLVSEAVEAGEKVEQVYPAVEYKRTHYGLIAQEVKQTLEEAGLSNTDFAGYCYEEDRDQHALRYSEFISPLIKAVQELTARVEKLENK